jgi:hypothetical protein
MRGWGLTLIILGIGSYILPLMGRQFMLVSIFGDSAWVGAGFIVFGAFFMLCARKPEDRE